VPDERWYPDGVEKHESGEDVLSVTDVDKLTDILAGKVPAGADE